MGRQYIIPGGLFINETASNEYIIPGVFFINETVATQTLLPRLTLLGVG